MSIKHHEVNILKNVIEKAQAVSSTRLQLWAQDLLDTVQKEIALEENAPAPAADPDATLGTLENPTFPPAVQQLSGHGALDASEAAAQLGTVIAVEGAVDLADGPEEGDLSDGFTEFSDDAAEVSGDPSTDTAE